MLKFFLLVSVLCFAGHSRVIYYKGNVLPVPFNAKLRYVVVNPPADFDPVYFEDAPDIETTTSTEANIKREICDESATNFGDCTDTTEDSVKTISFDITTESTTPAIEKECLYDCSDKCVLWDNRCQNNTDCPQCYQCSTEEFSVYKICKHVSRKNNTLSSTNGDFLFGSTTVEKITSPVTSPTFKYVDTTVYSTTFDADSENRDDLVPDDTTPTTFKKIETISPVIDPVSTSNKTDTTTKKIDKVEHVLTSTVESFPSSTFDTGSGSGDGKIPNDDEGDDDDYTETTERNNTAPTDLFLSNATTTTFKHVETATTMTTFNEIKTTTKKMDEDQSSTVLSSSFETGIGSGNGKIPDDNEGDDDDDDEFRGNIQRNNTASTDLFPSSTNITTLATENHIETTLTPLTNPVSNANKTTTKKIDDQNFLTSTVSSMTIDNGSESGDGKIPDDDDGGDDDDDESRENTQINNTASTDLFPSSTNITTLATENPITLTPLTNPVSTFNAVKTTTKKIDDHIFLTSTVSSMTIDNGSGSGDGKIPDDDDGGDDDDDEFRENTQINNTASTDLFPSSTNITTLATENPITLTPLTNPVSTFNAVKTTTKKIDDHIFLTSTVSSMTIDNGSGSGDGKIPDDDDGGDDDDDESRENTQKNNTESTDLFPSSTNITTLATENLITLTPLTNPVSTFNAVKTTTKKTDDHIFLTSTVPSMTIDTGKGSGDGKIPEDYERGDDDTEFETTFPLTDPLPKFEENKTITKKIAQNEDDQQTTTNPRTSLPCSYISFEDQLAKVTIDGVPLVITHNNVSDLFPNTTIEEVWERCHQVEKRCLEENCYGQEVVTKQYPCGMISTNLHTGRMTIDGVLVTPENITRLLPNARYEDVWTQCYRPRTSPKINYPCYMISFDEQRSRATLDGVVVTPDNFTKLIRSGSFEEMLKDCFNYKSSKVVPLSTTPRTPPKVNYPCYMISFDEQRSRVTLDGVVVTPNNFTKLIRNGSFKEMLKDCFNYKSSKVVPLSTTPRTPPKANYPCSIISFDEQRGRATLDGVVVTPNNFTKLIRNRSFEEMLKDCFNYKSSKVVPLSTTPRTPPKVNYPCSIISFDEQRGRATLDGVVVTPNNFTKLIRNGSFEEMLKDCFNYKSSKVVPLSTTPRTPPKANYPCSIISFDEQRGRATLDGVVVTPNNFTKLIRNGSFEEMLKDCFNYKSSKVVPLSTTPRTPPKANYPCSIISFDEQRGRATLDGVVVTPNNFTKLIRSGSFEEMLKDCFNYKSSKVVPLSTTPRTPPKVSYPCYMISFDEQRSRVTLDGVVVTPNNFTKLIRNGSFKEMLKDCFNYKSSKVVPLSTTPRTPPKVNYPCYMISFDEQRSRVTLDGVVVTPNNFTKLIRNGSFEEMVKDCFNYQPNKVCSGYGCNPITTPKSTGNGGGSHNGGGGKNNGGGGGSDEDYQYKDDDDDGNKDGDGSLKNFDDFIFLEKEINFK
ncbi:mucin-2 [Tribolium castaneum]|uniref:mucin-2 n=1 Tax=Tribolium castaneum TaxID=7070 RepID=UPI00046C3136